MNDAGAYNRSTPQSTPEGSERPASPAERRQRIALAEPVAGLGTGHAWSPAVLAGMVRLAELLLICLCGAAMHVIYLAPWHGIASPYLVAIPAVAVGAVFAFQLLGINNVGAFRAPLYQGFRLAGGWSLVFLTTLAIVFLLKLGESFSRVWLVGFYVLGLAALLVERALISALVLSLTRAGRLDRRTVIVGGGPAAEQLLEDLRKQDNSDLRIYGVFDDRLDARSPDVVGGYPHLGTVDDLIEFARHARIDLVIFTLPISAEGRILEMLRKLWVLPVDIRLAAHTNRLRFRPRSYSYIGNVPVLDLFDKPVTGWDFILKSAFDRIVGVMALAVLSPLLLLTAIAIKLDSRGPVLFRQKRYGFNNEIFEIYKFRSLYADKQDPEARNLVTKNDPRVTRVGRFIRKASIDELPQLFNVVFKGNLSLVGPRPHALHARTEDRAYEEIVEGYFARHRVKPGMTGWAQVNGWRGETNTSEKLQRRIEHDLYYIENWSLLFDLYILAITPFALTQTENAY